MTSPYPATAEMRSNFRHLIYDILWFGVLSGSTMAFLAVYATRIGATSFQISALSAGPAVVNLALSLPSGRWLEHRPLIRASFWSALLQRLGYLAIIPLPWLLGGRMEVWAIVVITLLMSIPGTLLAISFNALFADAVPPDWRGEVVGKRNAIVAVSMTLTTLISGQILDRVSSPYNYPIVFLLGGIGAMMSTYHLSRVRLTSKEKPIRWNRPLGELVRPGLQRLGGAARMAVGLRFLTRSQGKPLLRLDLLRSSYGLFMAAYLLFYTFQYTGIPLYPIFQVRDLALSDSQISLGSALFYAVMLLMSLRLSRLTARYGHRALLVAGALSFSLYPFFLGLASGPALFWVASLLGGAAWAVVSAGLLNRLMERVPDDERPAYLALHNLTLNLGILAGSLGAPVLMELVGLRPSLYVSAALRLLAGLVFLRWG